MGRLVLKRVESKLAGNDVGRHLAQCHVVGKDISPDTAESLTHSDVELGGNHPRRLKNVQVKVGSHVQLGGHRVNALKDVNAAITEVQAGIAVGDGD